MQKQLKYYPISKPFDEETLESYLRAVNEEEEYKGIIARIEDDQVIVEIDKELEETLITSAINDVNSAIRIATAQKQILSLFFPFDEEELGAP